MGTDPQLRPMCCGYLHACLLPLPLLGPCKIKKVLCCQNHGLYFCVPLCAPLCAPHLHGVGGTSIGPVRRTARTCRTLQPSLPAHPGAGGMCCTNQLLATLNFGQGHPDCCGCAALAVAATAIPSDLLGPERLAAGPQKTQANAKPPPNVQIGPQAPRGGTKATRLVPHHMTFVPTGHLGANGQRVGFTSLGTVSKHLN